MWRGQNWRSTLLNPEDDLEEANKKDIDSESNNTLPSESEDVNVSCESQETSISPSSEDVINEKDEVPFPTDDSNPSVTVVTNAVSLCERTDEDEATADFSGSYGELDPSMSLSPTITLSDYNSYTDASPEAIGDHDQIEDVLDSKEYSDGLSASILESETETEDNSSNTIKDPAACTKAILLLLEEAVEKGSALVLDEESLDADHVYQRSVALAKSAPPGPIFRLHEFRKVVVEKSENENQENSTLDSDTEESITLSMKGREKNTLSMKGREKKSSKIRRKDFDERCLNVVPQGTLGVDELAKLLT